MRKRKGEVGPFPADVKPVRPGIYRIKLPMGYIGFSFFNGDFWCNSGLTIAIAEHWIKDGSDGAIQEKMWCGLAKEQP